MRKIGTGKCRTTHYACNCFLERMGLLEKVATAAEDYIDHGKGRLDLESALSELRKKKPKA